MSAINSIARYVWIIIFFCSFNKLANFYISKMCVLRYWKWLHRVFVSLNTSDYAYFYKSGTSVSGFSGKRSYEYVQCVSSYVLQHNVVLICGNKMPTRCNRWFLYCRSYCLLNMFRAPLCPSSGAQDCYTGGCCLWCLVLWFSSCRSGVELRVMCPVCRMLQHPANRTHNPQLYTRPTTWKPKHQTPQAATTSITLLSPWWWA